MNEIDRNLDASGKSIVKKWNNLLIPLDTALIRGNMERAMKIFQSIASVIRDMLPYIRDQKLRSIVSRIADENERLAAKQSVLSDIDASFRKSIDLLSLLKVLNH